MPYQINLTPIPDPRGPTYLSSRREADDISNRELDTHNRTWNSTFRLPRLPELDSPLSLRSTCERHHLLRTEAPRQYRPLVEQQDESASQLGTQDESNATQNLQAQANTPTPRVTPGSSDSDRSGSSLSVHSYYGQTTHSHPTSGSQQVPLNSPCVESSASHSRDYETYLNPSLPQAQHIVHGSVLPMTQNSITSNRSPEGEARASWQRILDSNSNHPLQTNPHLSTVQGWSREIRRTGEEGPDLPHPEDAQAQVQVAPANYQPTRKRKPTTLHERSPRRKRHQPATLQPQINAQADLLMRREGSTSRGGQLDVSHASTPIVADTASQTTSGLIGIPEPPRPHFNNGPSNASEYSLTLRSEPHLGLPMQPGRTECRDINGPPERNIINGGFFPRAQGITFNNATMVDMGTYVQDNTNSQDTLLWLGGHIMKGAELDSSERSPPPRCHPGTRRTIIDKAQDWYNDPQEGKQLLWLRGQAGVGKSAIVQTLAEGWSEEESLGASLFFSRERRHTNPSQVFPSLAYQMATQDQTYGAYISELKRKNPRSLEKAIGEQFRLLFVEPFVRRKLRSGSKAWIITLDGLDECGEDEQTKRHADDIQRDIVELISHFSAQHPSVPLVWIIASRPEAHLQAVFAQGNIRGNIAEVEVPVDSPEACQDVEKYLDAEFRRIRERYPNHISESPWPTRSQFEKIAQASSGLFAFAAVIIRFIDDPVVRNPIEQLKWVMKAITRLLRSRNHLKNPLAALDVLYTVILSRIPADSYEVARQILGASMYLDRQKVPRRGWDLTLICNAYGIEKAKAITALSYLHSVIKFQPEAKSTNPRPSCYHTSFRDFLQDSLRSCEHFIKSAVDGGDFIRCTAIWVMDKCSRPDSMILSLQYRAVVSAVMDSIYGSEWMPSSTGIFFTLYSSEYQIPADILESFLDKVDGKFVKYVTTDKLLVRNGE
ncbi:hypothetical protein AN958_09101 [Leucoagaricus sp. SymC.cos]|nr:hypothetical protein AN958_09101 [Leucoagaricus sp. SymC.cos]